MTEDEKQMRKEALLQRALEQADRMEEEDELEARQQGQTERAILSA